MTRRAKHWRKQICPARRVTYLRKLVHSTKNKTGQSLHSMKMGKIVHSKKNTTGQSLHPKKAGKLGAKSVHSKKNAAGQSLAAINMGKLSAKSVNSKKNVAGQSLVAAVNRSRNGGNAARDLGNLHKFSCEDNRLGQSRGAQERIRRQMVARKGWTFNVKLECKHIREGVSLTMCFKLVNGVDRERTDKRAITCTRKCNTKAQKNGYSTWQAKDSRVSPEDVDQRLIAFLN